MTVIFDIEMDFKSTNMYLIFYWVQIGNDHEETKTRSNCLVKNDYYQKLFEIKNSKMKNWQNYLKSND